MMTVANTKRSAALVALLGCLFASQISTAKTAKKSTGILEKPEQSTDVGVSTKNAPQSVQRVRPIKIQTLDNSKIPNFLADVNSVMTSDDMVRDMDGIYAERLREYSLYNGFYATMDMGARPGFRGNIPREEAQLRRDMAKSIQKWMLYRGVPKFFAAKPATRKYAETYQTVAQNTKIEIKTESRWEYKTGFNLYQMRAFAQVGKDSFHFEASSALNKKYVLLASSNSFDKGKYSSNATFDIFRKVLSPSVSQLLAPNLSASLGTSLPLNELYIMQAAVTTISMNYAF